MVKTKDIVTLFVTIELSLIQYSDKKNELSLLYSNNIK